jgi:hypothetical protein
MNTESRGQSNQKQQKDKASRTLISAADQQSVCPTEAKNDFLIFRECEFTRRFVFSVRKHCVRVAGVIIKHVRVLAKFSPIVGPEMIAAR